MAKVELPWDEPPAIPERDLQPSYDAGRVDMRTRPAEHSLPFPARRQIRRGRLYCAVSEKFTRVTPSHRKTYPPAW